MCSSDLVRDQGAQVRALRSGRSGKVAGMRVRGQGLEVRR